jgi:hypothetical protein
MAVSHLRVSGILHFQPQPWNGDRTDRVPRAHVATILEVALAGSAEQIAAALGDVIQIQQPTRNARRNRAKPALALKQRTVSQVFAAEHQTPKLVRTAESLAVTKILSYLTQA